MIIWVNGAFGSGKTQASHELHRRIPGSFIYDPENIGYFLQKNIPRAMAKSDFQDYTLWREFNYSMLKHLDSEYDGVIIVPMTIVDPAIFDEIVGKLRSNGVILNHFTLWASADTLLKRLRSRGDGKHSWPAQQIDRCLKGLSDDVFERRINTEHLRIEEVAETIAFMLHIDLLPDPRGKLRKRLDRIKTQVKHIHWFN
jgi:hypothetical protein